MISSNHSRLRIIWKMRIRRFLHRFIYCIETPLELRESLIRLSHRNTHSFLALLRLFLSIPTWHFRVSNSISFKIMLNNIQLLDSQLSSADLINMRCISLWRARDISIRSLYRIYETIVAREYDVIDSKIKYFFYQKRRSWAVCRIQNSWNRDFIRYAILASMIEELAKAFNWRMSLRMRRNKRKHIYHKMLDEVLSSFSSKTSSVWATIISTIDIKWIENLSDDTLDSSRRLIFKMSEKSFLFTKRNIVINIDHFYTI